MKFVVCGPKDRFELLKRGNDAAEWVFVDDFESIFSEGADAFFFVDENAGSLDYSGINKPIFVHAVNTATNEIKSNKKNTCRINAWNLFLENDTWEVAGNGEVGILGSFQKKIIQVPDIIGFIAPRVVCSIVNEAYFALEDGVAGEEEINVAMKLGTNYPYGPFEWGRKIGLKNIVTLLRKLSKEDDRYRLCALLENKAEKN